MIRSQPFVAFIQGLKVLIFERLCDLASVNGSLSMTKRQWDILIGLFTLAILTGFAWVIAPIAKTQPLRFGVLVLIGLGFGYMVWRGRTATRRAKRQATEKPFPVGYRRILRERVDFYQRLSPSEKERFERKVQWFLADTDITGVGTEVDDLSRVLVAASAVIPIFGFDDWHYGNVDEVLLYPGSFDSHTFAQEGEGRNTLGMVGTGAMGRKVILSKPAVINGFLRQADGHNTGIHEFVHLLDASDGSYDGIPALLDKKYVTPWMGMMYREMKKIEHGHSILREYGATNKVEFFAVASELFFERPEKMRSTHPKLYDLLTKLFQVPSGKKA